MSSEPNQTADPSRPYAGLACPMCGYDLTGTLEPRCPECGKGFDPAKLRPVGAWRRLSWRLSAFVVLLAMYLPNTWVFWIDYPWNGYRMTWVKMFPILPVLYPAAWLAHWTGLTNRFDDGAMITLAGGVVLVLAACCTTLGRRSRRWLVLTGLVVLALEIANACICHALFRM